MVQRWYTQFDVAQISSAELEGRRKVMLYRSRQRGLLELDIILGSFAEKYLAKLTEAEVTNFGTILATENPDLIKFLNGQLPAPKELADNPVFNRILHHVNETN